MMDSKREFGPEFWEILGSMPDFRRSEGKRSSRRFHEQLDFYAESMMRTQLQIPVPQDRIRSFCKKNGVRKMWLYGSAVTGRFRPESDVDVMVEFREDKRLGWKLFTLHEELEPIWGRKVDLYTPQDFRPSRRAEILAGAKLVYDG